MNRHLDKGSLLVAIVTVMLFVAALFTKGITHDLFLEAGVFLVSVKIIMQGYRTFVALNVLDRKMDTILAVLAKESRREADAPASSQARSKPGE